MGQIYVAICKVVLDGDPNTEFGITEIGYFPNRCKLSFEIGHMQQAGGSEEEIVDVYTSENGAGISLMEVQAVFALD